MSLKHCSKAEKAAEQLGTSSKFEPHVKSHTVSYLFYKTRHEIVYRMQFWTLQELENVTILHEHLHTLTFKLTAINFHKLLDCLQDIRSENLKLLFPHPMLHLYSASCIKTQVKRWHNNKMQELPDFRKKDDFQLTLWEMKDEKGLESVEVKE